MIKHFLDLDDVPVDVLKKILANAHQLKKEKFHPPQLFSGLSLAMVFDKRSTRTRMSFEVAMKQLGGHVIVMTADDMHLTGAESIEDTAKVLSRYVDAAMFRISSHEKLLEIAGHSTIPVINGLTDHSHPCQIMADLMTIEEKLGTVQCKKIAWFGDYNNVARTIAQASRIWDFEMVAAVPEEPRAQIVRWHCHHVRTPTPLPPTGEPTSSSPTPGSRWDRRARISRSSSRSRSTRS